MTAIAEVRTSIEVPVGPERAFEVFTKGMNGWWNRAHHVQTGTLKDLGVEPHVGGRLWEENDAGDVCTWGRVLVWDPPSSFSFSWLIGPDWGVSGRRRGESSDRYLCRGALGTRVELVHDRLDVHGEGWESIRDGVGGAQGWPGALTRYAAMV